MVPLDSHFGDEKDRVVQRENGLYTYFASDIAYHLNKFERGFDKVINIWGADHHGYIPRVSGAIKALELDADKRCRWRWSSSRCSTATAQKASMSTRSGEFVTLRELRGEVGNDACRFFYALRKSGPARSISTSTWPRARPMKIRSTTSSMPTPEYARCSGSGVAI